MADSKQNVSLNFKKIGVSAGAIQVAKTIRDRYPEDSPEKNLALTFLDLAEISAKNDRELDRFQSEYQSNRVEP